MAFAASDMLMEATFFLRRVLIDLAAADAADAADPLSSLASAFGESLLACSLTLTILCVLQKKSC